MCAYTCCEFSLFHRAPEKELQALSLYTKVSDERDQLKRMITEKDTEIKKLKTMHMKIVQDTEDQVRNVHQDFKEKEDIERKTTQKMMNLKSIEEKITQQMTKFMKEEVKEIDNLQEKLSKHEGRPSTDVSNCIVLQ